MFPVTTLEIVSTERSRRHEGFRTWSRRRNVSARVDGDDTAQPLMGHRPTLRPALGH